MKFGTEFTTPFYRACGHKVDVTFRYLNQRQRAQQEVTASLTLCDQCRQHLQALVKDHAGKPCASSGVLSGRLPQMLGTVKTAPWASAIRAEACKYYFPLLEAVASSGVQPCTAARNVIRLLFSVQAASFWIGARASLCSDRWLIAEVEYMLRGTRSGSRQSGESSVIRYWRDTKPDLIKSARRSATNSNISA